MFNVCFLIFDKVCPGPTICSELAPSPIATNTGYISYQGVLEAGVVECS